jgi:glycosyltransferase involved in cell wall biosynthesis
MESQRPSVSVIVPVYNGAAFLADAVDSIGRQTQPPDEVIVIDDGSTDATPAIAARWRGIRYRYQPNAGPAAARNRGLEMATGDIIGMLDADDLWPSERMRLLLTRLAEDPTLDAVLGRTQFIARQPGDEGPHGEPLTEPVVALTLGGALFRRSAFERVGRFDTRMPCAEDLDWFLRALEQRLCMAAIDRVTLLYRMHAANMTRDGSAVHHGIATALRESIVRRRTAGGGSAAPLPAIPGCGPGGDALRHAIELQTRRWTIASR